MPHLGSSCFKQMTQVNKECRFCCILISKTIKNEHLGSSFFKQMTQVNKKCRFCCISIKTNQMPHVGSSCFKWRIPTKTAELVKTFFVLRNNINTREKPRNKTCYTLTPNRETRLKSFYFSYLNLPFKCEVISEWKCLII